MGKVDECLLSQVLLAYNWECEKLSVCSRVSTIQRSLKY